MLKLMKLITSHSAFTLIEMMIVLMIISILLLIAVPNMSKSHAIVNDKSCQATVKLVQGQVAAYEMDSGQTLTDLSLLQSNGYIDSVTCPDGTALQLINDVVSAVSTTSSTP